MAFTQNYPASGSPPGGGLTWNTLDLTTWGSYQAAPSFDTSTPAWALDSNTGLVHLRGVVEALNNDYHGTWGRVPASIAPAHQKWMVTWGRDGSLLYPIVLYVVRSGGAGSVGNINTEFGAMGDFFIPPRDGSSGNKLLVGLDNLSYSLL